MGRKVLVLTPIYQASGFLDVPYRGQDVKTSISVLESFRRLDPQPERFIFLENNSLDDTLARVVSFARPKEVVRLWFREDAMSYVERHWHAGEPAISSRYDLIGICRQLLLQRARKLDPDYAIFLDADIVVLSEDLIDRLCRWENLDIVGAPYLRYFPQGRLLSAIWPNPNPTPEYPFQLLPLENISSERPTEALAVGGGCMRLSRKVIQDKTLNFYPVQRPWLGFGPLAEDFGYCLQARALGYNVHLDPAAKLAHWSFKPEQLRSCAWAVDGSGALIHFRYA